MIYLNNSATTYPKPPEVINAISNAFLSYEGDSSRLFSGDSIDNDIISLARKKIANFFNIKKENNLIFTSGSTESLNLLIRGFEYQHRRIITTVTEHNSVLRPLYRVQKGSSIELSFIPCDGDGYIDFDVLSKEVSKPFDYFIINHASNVTGSIQNIEKIGEIVKHYNGFFIIDASQSAGAESIDIEKSNVDFIAFTGHKSLYGVSGIGGFYVSDELKKVLNPLKVGGTGVRSLEKTQPQELPFYYEAGTKNYMGILSLYHGVSFVEKTSIEAIKKHKNRMVQIAFNNLKNIKEINIVSPNVIQKGGSIFAFNVNNFTNEDIVYILKESFDIIVRSGYHCAPLMFDYIGYDKIFSRGTIRVTPSYFTTESEMESFCFAIKEIVGI